MSIRGSLTMSVCRLALNLQKPSIHCPESYINVEWIQKGLPLFVLKEIGLYLVLILP